MSEDIITQDMDSVKCVVCEEELEFEANMDYYITWSATCCKKFYYCSPHMYSISIDDEEDYDDE